jgi:hypothetical protein
MGERGADGTDFDLMEAESINTYLTDLKYCSYEKNNFHFVRHFTGLHGERTNRYDPGEG